MKKFLSLFLTVIMLAGLCGCLKTEDVRGDILSGNQSQSQNENEDKNKGEGKNEDENKDENKDEDEPEFSLGNAANNTYNNDFLGISCALPAEWVFYTDEQILELNNIVGDVLDEEVAEQLKNATIIYDMFASYETEGSSININLEKLNALQLINLDIKQTLEAQIDAIKSTYKNMGYTDINIAYQTVTVDGKDFDGLELTAKIQGIDFYVTVFTFRKSNYLANITICSLQTDKTDTILNYFTVK